MNGCRFNLACRLNGLALAIITVTVSIGCDRSPQESAEVAHWRSQLVASSEPADAITITELATQFGMITAAEATETATTPANDAVAAADTTADATPLPAGSEVVVVGRIYSGDIDPFESGQAAFVMTELPEEGHGEGHDPDNCPFCKRRAARLPSAIVRFLDESGKPLAIDARQLLAVKAKDIVVIRGIATPGEMNTISIDANQLAIRSR